jgi:hypothetical protein
MIATTITAIARMIVSSCAIFASWRQVDEPEVREANRERCVSYFTLRRLSKKCSTARPLRYAAPCGSGHNVNHID